ncbi:MAG: A/G-specific adenine glycosylase [Candidatus Pacebacteria bacterium]|nr:A/G-specific adenine glycosylase [Candidatus Paceibacterota bacterium]
MKSNIRIFRKKILRFYKENGRHGLPWRKTHNPYKILVSEIMLQQTQVDRVIPKYKAFLEAFPTVQKLANAKLSHVLLLWSGLGYNRRARMLHDAAKQVVFEHSGHFPKDITELLKLPGVGSYTARAIVTFAYNEPVVMIETNIRSVFIHEFFGNVIAVDDTKIVPLIEASSVKERDSRRWYAALMDYGSYLKKEYPNPSRKSKHHSKQSKFRGSLREVRGDVLKILLNGNRTVKDLVKESGFTSEKIEEALGGLCSDGLTQKTKRGWGVI